MSARDTGFYQTKQWKKVRQAYWYEQGGKCERCDNEDTDDMTMIVHHKDHLTEEDIQKGNFKKMYGFENLELLCIDCHNKEHGNTSKPTKEGYIFDDNGDLIKL